MLPGVAGQNLTSQGWSHSPSQRAWLAPIGRGSVLATAYPFGHLGPSPLSNQQDGAAHGHAGAELAPSPGTQAHGRKGLKTLTIRNTKFDTEKLSHATSYGWYLGKFMTGTEQELIVLSTASWTLIVLSQNNIIHIRSRKTTKNAISGKCER